MENEKNCKNCKYFKQFYVKDATRFLKVNYGDCSEHYINMKERRSFPFFNGCENWRPIEITEEVRRERIEIVLRDMCARIIEIAELIRNGDA